MLNQCNECNDTLSNNETYWCVVCEIESARVYDCIMSYRCIECNILLDNEDRPNGVCSKCITKKQ